MNDETPPGTRLILVSENILTQFGTRTDNGFAITAEWGEPSPEGWYEPTFTATDDGRRVVTQAHLLNMERALRRARLSLKGARGLASDHDDGAADIEYAEAIDIIDVALEGTPA